MVRRQCQAKESAQLASPIAFARGTQLRGVSDDRFLAGPAIFHGTAKTSTGTKLDFNQRNQA